MSEEPIATPGVEAHHSFEEARQRAFLDDVLRHLRGRPANLLPFEEVRQKLGLLPSAGGGLQDIPLDRIVGSVGRYRDFTRSFLPRDAELRTRWTRVYAVAHGLAGLPPIEVYQVGDVYFVKDGNHRVSVARQMGAKTIQAYVTVFTGPARVSLETDLDDLILRSEHVRFQQHTRLDELRPAAHVEVTMPGYYEKLEEHIAVHGYFMGIERQCDVSWEDAVTDWYDNVYLPVVRIIREHNILPDFPGRTEADLYLWTMEHRHYLTEELEQDISVLQAAKDLAEKYSTHPARAFSRMQYAGAEATPEEWGAGPPPGRWRQERVEPRGGAPLFQDLLLPIDGSPSSWSGLQQALPLARQEKSRVYGLFVAQAESDADQTETLGQEFVRRCQADALECKFFSEVGAPERAIRARSRWADVIVMCSQGQHARWPERVLGSTMRAVIPRASRPILVTLREPTALSRALLAYDGSPMSEEALYVAAYLGRHWGIPLAVVTVEENRRATRAALDKALAYLHEHGTQAEGLLRHGTPAEQILAAGQEWGCDWLLLGAGGFSPFGGWFTPSTLARVLHEATVPVLLCR